MGKKTTPPKKAAPTKRRPPSEPSTPQGSAAGNARGGAADHAKMWLVKSGITSFSISAIWLFLLVAVFSLVVDVLSMPPAVSMEDAGEFITSAFKLGIPHPPGYPLFVWLGHLFTLLPFASVAWKVHLFSATCGAGACGFVTLCTRRIGADSRAALLAGTILAVSKTFWSQAVIAEVYALNALLFFALLWIALGIHENFSKRRFYAFAFVYGLSLSNHWPLIMLASGVFAVLFWQHRRQMLPAIPIALLCLLAGLSPYLLLFAANPEITFLGPIRNLKELWDYILRKEYTTDDVQATATVRDSVLFTLDFLRMLSLEFGPLGAPFILIGAWLLAKTRRVLFFALVAAFLSSPVVLLFAVRLEFNILTRDVFSVFHLLPIGIAALWAGLGFSWVLDLAFTRFRQFASKTARIGASIAALVILLAQATAINARMNYLRHDTFPLEFARLSLESLPANAVFLGWADPDVGPFVYASVVEGIRPDVTYSTQTGVILNKFYDRREVKLDTQRAERTVQTLKRWFAEGRRVFTFRRLYYFTTRPAMLPYKYVSHGLYDEIVNDPSPKTPPPTPDLVDKAVPILDRVVRGEYGELWSYHRNVMIARLCRVLSRHGIDHPVFAQNRECKIVRAERLHDSGDLQGADHVLEQLLIDGAQLPLLDQLESARFFFTNRIEVINKSPVDVATRFRNFQATVDRVLPLALRVPGCGNQLALALLEARKQIELNVQLTTIERMFGRCAQYRKILKEIHKK